MYLVSDKAVFNNRGQTSTCTITDVCDEGGEIAYLIDIDNKEISGGEQLWVIHESLSNFKEG